MVLDRLGGCKLTARATAEGGVAVTDENGTVANLVAEDVLQSNGAIQVVDAVLRPVGM